VNIIKKKKNQEENFKKAERLKHDILLQKHNRKPRCSLCLSCILTNPVKVIWAHLQVISLIIHSLISWEY